MPTATKSKKPAITAEVNKPGDSPVLNHPTRGGRYTINDGVLVNVEKPTQNQKAAPVVD